MNTIVRSQRALVYGIARLIRIVSNSSSATLGLMLIAASLSIAVPRSLASSTQVTVTVGPGASESDPVDPMLWTDTGINLSTADETVTCLAYGSWQGETGPLYGPQGTNNGSSDVFINANDFSLIAYVGSNPYQGEWPSDSFFPQSSGYWEIGSFGQFTSSATGELWLGFNDDAQSGIVGDNSGSATSLVSTSISSGSGFEIVDVQFAFEPEYTKTGMAAVGNSSSDYWNVGGRDPGLDPPPSGDPSFTITCANTLEESASITINAYTTNSDPPVGDESGNGSGDPMLQNWVLTEGGSPFLLDVDLGAGTYDIYFYSVTPVNGYNERSPSTFTLISGAENISDYSPETPGSSHYPIDYYVEGNQYVVFSDVVVSSIHELVFEVSSDTDPVCNGMQIVKH